MDEFKEDSIKQELREIKESVVSHNAKEEVNELIDNHEESGLSKGLDPTYRVTKDETLSPRGQMINLKKGLYTEILYRSTLCMGSDEASIPPLPYTRIIRKARRVLVEQGLIPQTEEFRALLKEINDYIAD